MKLLMGTKLRIARRFGSDTLIDPPDKDDDIVHAAMRMVDAHEQGNRRGTCGWITSFLRKNRFLASILRLIRQAMIEAENNNNAPCPSLFA